MSYLGVSEIVHMDYPSCPMRKGADRLQPVVPMQFPVLFKIRWLAIFFPVLICGCHTSSPPTIAVVPRTTAVMMWEPEHRGVLDVALSSGTHVYWNAPTREDDIQGQIAMVERVAEGDYQGLVLAPDHSLALIAPVRKAISRGIHVVVIGSPLGLTAGKYLSYVLNDEETGGRIAAERTGAALHGEGSVAVLGIDPDISGIMERARSFEETLAERYPRIHIVANQAGSFNMPHEQQMADETFREHPDLDAVVALTSTSVEGVLSAIHSDPKIHARVIIFDPDSLSFDCPNIDSLILEDTRAMGTEAMRILLARLQGRDAPAVVQLKPVLVTRENQNSAEIRNIVTNDWQPDSIHWKWRSRP
jgi:ribose transport system substrate-binding protein